MHQRSTFRFSLAAILVVAAGACMKSPPAKDPSDILTPANIAFSQYHSAGEDVLASQEKTVALLEESAKTIWVGPPGSTVTVPNARITALQNDINVNDLLLTSAQGSSGSDYSSTEAARVFYLLVERVAASTPSLQTKLSVQDPSLLNFSTSPAAGLIKSLYAAETQAKGAAQFALYDNTLRKQEVEKIDRLKLALSRVDASETAQPWSGTVDGVADVQLDSPMSKALEQIQTRCPKPLTHERGVLCQKAMKLFGAENDILISPKEMDIWENQSKLMSSQMAGGPPDLSLYGLDRYTVGSISVLNLSPEQQTQVVNTLVTKYGGRVFESTCMNVPNSSEFVWKSQFDGRSFRCGCLLADPGGELFGNPVCVSESSVPAGASSELSVQLFANGQIEVGSGGHSNLVYRSRDAAAKMLAELQSVARSQADQLTRLRSEAQVSSAPASL